MDDLHKLHKIHSWMWEIDKKYFNAPLTDDAWSEIINGADQLASELDLKHSSYPMILIADFMHAKERYEVAIKTA